MRTQVLAMKPEWKITVEIQAWMEGPLMRFSSIRMVMAFMIIRMWMEMDFWRRSEEMPMMWWMMW